MVAKNAPLMTDTSTVLKSIGSKRRHSHWSKKYLGQYLREFDWRYNVRKIEDAERTLNALKMIGGKRLMLKAPSLSQKRWDEIRLLVVTHQNPNLPRRRVRPWCAKVKQFPFTKIVFLIHPKPKATHELSILPRFPRFHLWAGGMC
jgi:hypothetical protein